MPDEPTTTAGSFDDGCLNEHLPSRLNCVMRPQGREWSDDEWADAMEVDSRA